MRSHLEIFLRFLLLGCTSFGGPAAHIGYFRKLFVERLKWLDESVYAGLIALSQFLPGPGSSQVCFAIGHRRGGIWGGVAASLGFTLPSFILMICLAGLNPESELFQSYAGIIHGLKLFAVIVVADATYKMGQSFCRDSLSIGIAGLTAILLWSVPGVWIQIGVLLLAAAIGYLFRRAESIDRPSHTAKVHRPALILFGALLILGPLLMHGPKTLALFADFYQAGSMVFGGGHVVLPLLQGLIGEALPTDRFLTAYATAQAVPGPMFTIATFLGSELMPQHRILGATIATVAIFLPGNLLVLAVYDSWANFASKKAVAAAIWGIHAGVVGLLASTLYTPVFVSAVQAPIDMALLAVGAFLYYRLKLPILPLIAFFATAGYVLTACPN
ncbi:chromate efflux transporter [Coraliomargarita akajimensis]|uniref:Chromate transporter, chromate ion transporter (CHR) family n=1 Tax=Coraliomargarita akajimensis (strain DSM 45221 / IAM 15411 / JCM 23193 / KCTC 12865 / 04OKA010-24) TaxID=583355 RepID=D5EP17_CORAD|nr:chromate efflux transporter [Coraliomargarita akajimensis]ADE55527.1 chromate transporter, chromate ion transporter (CHR) family [Coraliomargarita akajimensis DSM 45221]